MLAEGSVLKGLCVEPPFRALLNLPKHAYSLVFKGSLMGEGLEGDLRTSGAASLSTVMCVFVCFK